MIQEMLNLFSALITNEGGAISSKPLTDSFGWTEEEVCIHQDIQELNRLLFEQIEIALKNTPESSLINDLFRGVQCTRDEFHDINLSVTDHDSVEDCLAAHTQLEQLTGDNKYFCDSCKTKVDAVKMTRFAELPPILTISLSRFYFDPKSMQSVKLEKMCSFPLILDMSSFLIEKPRERVKYDLFSVVLHVGGSTRGGHYHAYVKDPYGTAQDSTIDNSLNNECNHPPGLGSLNPDDIVSSNQDARHHVDESVTDIAKESPRAFQSNSSTSCRRQQKERTSSDAKNKMMSFTGQQKCVDSPLVSATNNLGSEKMEEINVPWGDLEEPTACYSKAITHAFAENSPAKEDTDRTDVQSEIHTVSRTSNCTTITEMVRRICLTRQLSLPSDFEYQNMSDRTKNHNTVEHPSHRITSSPKKCSEVMHQNLVPLRKVIPISHKRTPTVDKIHIEKACVRSASKPCTGSSTKLSGAIVMGVKSYGKQNRNRSQLRNGRSQFNRVPTSGRHGTFRGTASGSKLPKCSTENNKRRSHSVHLNQHNSRSIKSKTSSPSLSSHQLQTPNKSNTDSDLAAALSPSNVEWRSKLFNPSRNYKNQCINLFLQNNDVSSKEMRELRDLNDAKYLHKISSSINSRNDLDCIPSFKRSYAQLVSRPSGSNDHGLAFSVPDFNHEHEASTKVCEMQQIVYVEDNHVASDVQKNECTRHNATNTTESKSNDSNGYTESVVGKWFDINDDYIAEVDPTTFDRVFEGPECAYMLFYRLFNLPLPISTL